MNANIRLIVVRISDKLVKNLNKVQSYLNFRM